MTSRARHQLPLGIEEDNPRLSASIVGAAFLAAFLLRFSYVYLDDITRAHHGTFLVRFIEEFTGLIGALLLFPAVVWLERRRPLDMGRWRASLPWHAAALVLYSLAHTTFMAVSRWAVFPALGQGSYDYGIMWIRYFMEAPQDVISYASFVGVLTLLRVHQRLQREQIHAAALGRDAAEARLEALTLRLQPHFLFNALNTIASAVYDNPVAADVMIGHLGDLLRHALRTGERPEIAVAEELEVLRAYLGLIEARFGDRVDCALDIAPETLSLRVPAFLLQPLVENAVRHGSAMAGVGVRGSVYVGVRVDRNTLEILVENDVGSPDGHRSASGTGLRTTADRLQLLYGDAHRFSAAAVDGRFRVSVRIPARPAAPPDFTTSEPTHAGAHR